MQYSGIIPVAVATTRIVECNIGQEVTVFGLVFSNTSNVERTVILTLFRQSTGSAQSIQRVIGPKASLPWDKPISMQPGDRLDVNADQTGVSLLWSIDEDTGVNPVLTGFTIRGQYSNVANYDALDIVFMNGSSYVAIRANVAKDPETETADWMLLLDGSGMQTAIDAIVAGAPLNLDTLQKLSNAIGNDPDFASNVANALALKANSASLATVAFTGNFNDLSGVKKLAVRRLFATRELF